ncbi:MAG: hypothetical protein QOJ02_472 [Acidobacteriota bacterium]|jgi:hypothetical protein|nr:hypothetical protein [Acidobacteriota bacterium]
MTTSLVDEERLKELLKTAIIEVLEDAALARAIEEGDSSYIVSREEVFRLIT